MPLMRINGSQIQLGAIKNEHIGEPIEETKLNIAWSTHYNNALATKKLLDYVQKNGVSVASGVSVIDNIIDAAEPHVEDATSLGIITSDFDGKGKNKVVVRDAVTGEPILDASNREVYGRLTWDSTLNSGSGGYKLSFYTFDGTNENAYAFAANATIDIQYMRRFTLLDVDESFSANEKFVDGAADVTAHLNIEQLARDIYGTASLDRDGQPNLGTPLVTQIANEAAARTAADSTLQSNIETEAINRANADNAIRSDFASTAAGKGASLVGVEDAGNKFTASTVEGVLAELQSNIESEASTRAAADTTLQGNIDAEASARQAADQAIRDDLASTAAGKGASLIGVEDASGKFAATTVEGVLAEIDSAYKAADSALQAGIDAEETARIAGDQAIRDDLASTAAGKGASLIGVEDSAGKFAATTVEGVLAEIDSKVNSYAHTHYKVTVTLSAPASVVDLPTGKPSFTVGDDSLDVYVNGVLQEVGVHYAEEADGRGVDFGATVLEAGTKVTFRYFV